MAATKDDIRSWFRKGVFSSEAPYRYMVIRCDTLTWDDYPSYCVTAAGAKAIISSPGYMQKVVEVYDLTMDMETQLSEQRAWRP